MTFFDHNNESNHILRRLAAIEQQLAVMISMLRKQGAMIMATQADFDAAITDLQAKVTADTNATTAAETLLTNLTALLKSALATAGGTDAQLAAVKAAVATIDANNSALAASVTANTPAAPAP